MANLVLRFSSAAGNPALDSVHFVHPLLETPRFSYRGKGLSGCLCRYSFQWSPAVRAISMLLLRTKGNDCSHGVWPTFPIPALNGGLGSKAASLDYAISKRPLWLLDMFGATSDGRTLAHQVFIRWNPERKRGGEVSIAVNPQQLKTRDIEIFLDQAPLTASQCALLANSIGGHSPQTGLTRNLTVRRSPYEPSLS